MTAAFDQVAMSLDLEVPAPLASIREPAAIRALLIEDGATDLRFLVDELSKKGFAVETVASLACARDAARDVDVIVLHCDWAQVSSIDLLGELHRLRVDVPIVLLAGEAWPAREDAALDKSAINVSRSSEVLARRLKHAAEAVGRTPQPQTDGIVCGKLLLRPDISRACWKGADVGLTLGEYNIVHLLASNVGRYVTYRAIYDRLHYEGFIAGNGADGYRANVRSAIKRIRNKFRACDPTFYEIENYNGFGYCWKKPD
jgi:two-component system response regulator ChvI